MAFMRGKGILGITLTIFLLTLIALLVEEIAEAPSFHVVITGRADEFG